MASQLSVLIASKTFSTSIGDVKIGPFKILTEQGAEAIAIVDRYLEVLSNPENNKDDMTMLRALLGTGEKKAIIVQDILHILHVASEVTKDKLQELGHDEVINLLSEVLKQNMDFFPKVLRLINPPKEEETQASPKTGESESAD